MLNALITLDQIKSQLRITDEEQDDDLQFKIYAASGAVMLYLGDYADEFTDSSGMVEIDSSGDPVGVPEVVQYATIYLTAVMYKDRDTGDQFANGALPQTVKALLNLIRPPVVA